MDKRNLPIAFFDSGVGGISVLREALALMPRENYVYFGDSANAPYGTKTVEEIRALTLGHAERFYRQGIKALVIACNTATSAAIQALRSIYTDIPVIGIEPALKPAALMAEHPTVIVMATPLTVSAAKFHELLGHYSDKADVIPLGCPGLMEFVEMGCLDTPQVENYLKERLGPYLSRYSADAIVLGCTHYPFVEKAIRRNFGRPVEIIDGSAGTARQLKRQLAARDLLSDRTRPGRVTFENSIPEKAEVSRALFESPFSARRP